MTVKILLFIAGFILLIAIVIIFSLKKIIKKRLTNLKKRFNEYQIIEYERFANCFGIKSKGYFQIRGNGILILTEKFLFFQMLFPKKEILISLSDIQKTEISMSHQGKTKGRKLLKIGFTNDRKKMDSVAFLVSNLDIWYKKLKKIS
ncbi:MAG: hypothetical protein FXF47_02790 [Candidatus Mcinerneyibacterium aminivorans]|uniref:GRAM domain-containing protein n=1 Tax=Candidatus Mcinerneyibacterium aminivorans TaxID=2703815 RepID=A0A5D0MIG3_9BACT|nr:MAG: hypothetical protein FXF47_02790 [Candidatus Mcinerneyibacterium aminivorans]